MNAFSAVILMDADWTHGLGAWLQWCGLADTPKAMQTWSARLANERPKLDAIGEMLYRPPNENDKGSQGAKPDADMLYRSISQSAGIPPRPFWPAGAPYAICVTHDIDRIFATYQRLRGFFHAPFQTIGHVAHDVITRVLPQWRQLNPFHNFHAVVEIERAWGITSAAYVLFERPRPWLALERGEIQHVLGAYDARDIAEELRLYEAANNEVGIHGSFDSWNDADALARELGELHSGGIRKVFGARNHYLQYDFLKTPAAQAKAGLVYDSSLGFNFRSGFRCGTCFPFSLHGMLEIPLLLMDTALRHSCETPRDRQKTALSVLEAVRQQHGILMVDWHLQFMNADYFPDWVDLLGSLVGEGKKDGAWFALPKDLTQWWMKRGSAPES